jgi:hypothetical protein
MRRHHVRQHPRRTRSGTTSVTHHKRGDGGSPSWKTITRKDIGSNDPERSSMADTKFADELFYDEMSADDIKQAQKQRKRMNR